MVEASCFRGQREAAADLTGIPEIIITHSVNGLLRGDSDSQINELTMDHK